MEYKNYFWDFDGTLYNSYPGMIRAFVETLKTQEIELDSKEVYKIMREASVRKAFKLYGENLDIPKLRQMYHSFEEQYQDKMRLFDGAADVCRKIKENGGRNFLLTHRDSSALNILKRDNLDEVAYPDQIEFPTFQHYGLLRYQALYLQPSLILQLLNYTY